MIELPRIPLGDVVEDAVDALVDGAAPFFDAVATVISTLFEGIAWLLHAPEPVVMILILAVLGLVARGWVFGVGTLVGFSVIAMLNQWTNAMDTLALILVAAVIAILISVPLGILAARNRTASNIMRPVLDFLQTMPPFVYLIPALLLFGIGDVPGIVATVLFAVAPGVRLTELGIRGVDAEVVEAAYAFGASPRRILRQVQLPLAMPSILAGVNQVIMLSLSMVVIASMVGAGGLGNPVLTAINRIDVGLGFEGGISVVILAIFLDRITASFGGKRSAFLSLFVRPKNTAVPAPAPQDAVEAEPARA